MADIRVVNVRAAIACLPRSTTQEYVFYDLIFWKLDYVVACVFRDFFIIDKR